MMDVCIAAKEAESKSVAVLYEHRAAPKGLERTKVIDEVIAHVPRPPHTVKLKGASKTISIQACAPCAGCSVACTPSACARSGPTHII